MEKPNIPTEKPGTTSATYPKWLLNSLNDISDSREWNGFVADLQDTIEQQLLESHVKKFIDLGDEEKLLFVNNAVLALNNSPAYQVVSKEVSTTLDDHINDSVSHEMRLGRNPFLTRTELLLSSVQEAIVGIIDRWPELRGKMARYLNQPLPQVMRHHVWRVFLKNDKVNEEYHEILNNTPRVAVSPQDKEITQRVEQMLNSEPTFSDMRGSVGCFYGMKAVLSYYHALKKSASRLTDTEILLMAPFIQVIADKISRKEPASLKVMEVLVQEYFTFLKSRPSYMTDQGTGLGEYSDDVRQFSQEVMSFVSKINPRITQAYMDAFAPSSVDIVATETKMFETLGDAMVSLIRPIIRPLFVGVLNRETLFYVWDQYIIGLDTPGFHDLFLPAVTACFLALVGKAVISGQNQGKFEASMRKEGLKLKPADFQYIINEHFHSDLFRRITKEKMAPSLDPTLKPFDTMVDAGDRTLWQSWYSDFTQPTRTKPIDRDHFRVLREQEKNRLRELERRHLDEESRRIDLEQSLRVLEASMEAELQTEVDRSQRERVQLENQLANERQLREMTEKTAKDELRHLQDELDYLRSRSRGPDPGTPRARDGARHLHGLTRPPSRGFSRPDSTGSLNVFPPPPGSPESQLQEKPRTTVTEKQLTQVGGTSSYDTADEKTKEALEDYLRMFMAGAHYINECDAPEQGRLKERTERFINENRLDKAEAELEVFGKRLDSGELEHMDEGNNNYYQRKLMSEMFRLAQQRRKRELDAAASALPRVTGPI